MKSSIFQNFVKYIGDQSLIVITKLIQDGKYKNQVLAIRSLIEDGNQAEADNQKKQLPAFTPSGIFHNGRKANLLTEYSCHVILDIDKIPADEITTVIENAAKVPHTFSAFISPSGNGVKIIVFVNSPAQYHKIAFSQVAAYYESYLHITIDPSGKDVSRLCFMSYDPDCYRNIYATEFEVKLQDNYDDASSTDNSNNSDSTEQVDEAEQANEKEDNPASKVDWEKTFGKCIDFTEKKSSYTEGNRNNFIHLLACNCNRVGIPQTDVEKLMVENYDLDSNEIRQSIDSAYTNNTQDFAKFANLAASNDETVQSKDELLTKMPFLPESIFNNLPCILQHGAAALQDRREKDIFITGALAIISGCMRNVIGLYRGKEQYSNLFVFIIAPAASGKGALTYSKQLGDKYHDKLVEASLKAKKIYDQEMAAYKRAIMNPKTNIKDLEPPEEPPFKVLFIPANNSSARIIQHLKEGDEQGIFCETEADTMGNVLKQDWGSYSDLLRKSFHHEPISYSRKTNKEWVELKKPRLSVALAGTPGQVEGLIKSAEDGLFSRFIFYTFKSDALWVNAGPTMDGVNLSKHYEDLSIKVLAFVEFLFMQDKINFELIPSQWDRLNIFGDECLNTLSTFISEDMSSTSKRLGLILFRICMVLTTLRYFDNGETSTTFICTDEDFETALQMTKVYQEHSVFMFKELPKNATVTDKILKAFYDALPAKFRRKEAITLADVKFNIKNRTADTYISKLVAFKWLTVVKTGYFQKIK